MVIASSSWVCCRNSASSSSSSGVNVLDGLTAAEVDITKLDPKKELRAASSLLEMLLLVLMRNFNLSSKECVTLLSS